MPRLSVDMRARMIRDAGAGKPFALRMDAVEREAKEQIRAAVADALHDHGIDVDDFYGLQATG